MNDRSIVGNRPGSQWYGGHVGRDGQRGVWFGSGWSATPGKPQPGGWGTAPTTGSVPSTAKGAVPHCPLRVIPVERAGDNDAGMQVIASNRTRAGQPTRAGVATALVIGTALVAASLGLLYLVFGENFVDRFMPSGRPSTYELVAGALVWTFALTAPAGFGLVGVSRLVTAYDRWRARRPRVTPAVRLRRAIGDDHVVATGVRLPDGSRVLPELVLGPFGAAIIEELPPVGAVMSRGVRSWEVRVGNGHIRTIENPLVLAAHDAERVRAWLTPDDADHVLKVYAAVVGVDPRVERSASVAVVNPSQVAEWLGSLPPQKSLDAGRREKVIKEIRAAL
jgi:hypothetical protein